MSAKFARGSASKNKMMMQKMQISSDFSTFPMSMHDVALHAAAKRLHAHCARCVRTRARRTRAAYTFR
jgi:hypothetical protein